MGREKYKSYMKKVNIRLVAENVPEYIITSSEEAKRFFVDYMQECDREYFVALLLGTKNNLQSIYEISVGTLNQSLIHPREVFKAAILANANAIILAHNHPSGDVTPSAEDLLVTKRLRSAGKILGIEVLDHLIVGSTGSSYSFSEEGRMFDCN